MSAKNLTPINETLTGPLLYFNKIRISLYTLHRQSTANRLVERTVSFNVRRKNKKYGVGVEIVTLDPLLSTTKIESSKTDKKQKPNEGFTSCYQLLKNELVGKTSHSSQHHGKIYFSMSLYY